MYIKYTLNFQVATRTRNHMINITISHMCISGYVFTACVHFTFNIAEIFRQIVCIDAHVYCSSHANKNISDACHVKIYLTHVKSD